MVGLNARNLCMDISFNSISIHSMSIHSISIVILFGSLLAKKSGISTKKNHVQQLEEVLNMFSHQQE